MNILKSLLVRDSVSILNEGKNLKQGLKEIKAESNHGIPIEDFEKKKTMEFMYCIPDLEVFIDKTIKKCLLEYDLDANDTEAVLDDMEKAWPVTPPRSTEKKVLKDCNDNTEKGRGHRQHSSVNQIHEARLLTGSFDKNVLKNDDAIQSPEKTVKEETKLFSEKMRGKSVEKGELLSSGRREAEHRNEESDRSGSSSPDVNDGKLQNRRQHPKLKSRLQQRYFEGNHEPDNDSGDQRKDQNKTVVNEPPQDFGGQNNLDLLASAVNIHTESVRREEEMLRLQDKRRLQEEAIRRLQDDPGRRQLEEASKPFQPISMRGHRNNLNDTPSPLKDSPLIVRDTFSEIPPQQFSTNSTTTFGSSHNKNDRNVNESPHSCHKPFSESFLRGESLPGISRPDSMPGLSRAESLPVNNGRPMEDSTVDRARMLLQHYQNGYHALIPREQAAQGRELPNNEMAAFGDRRHLNSSSTVTREKVDERSLDSERDRERHHAFRPSHPVYLSNQRPSPNESTFCHGSRIATIIAEELQKDDDCQRVRDSKPNIPVHEHIIPPKTKTSLPHEIKTGKPSASFTQKQCSNVRQLQRNIEQYNPTRKLSHQLAERQSSNALPLHPNTERQSVSVRHHHSFDMQGSHQWHHQPPMGHQQNPRRFPEHLQKHTSATHGNQYNSNAAYLTSAHPVSTAHSINAHMINRSTFLPSHMPTNHHFNSPVVASAHKSFNPAMDITKPSPYIRTHVPDDEEPQDLSIKSRKRDSDAAVMKEQDHHPVPRPSSETPPTKCYYSTPNSPVTCASPSHPTEAVAFRKSLSPNTISDKECDYASSRNGVVKAFKGSGSWEKRGQVHGLDFIPSVAMDSKVLAEKRRVDALKRWSETRDVEMNKNRKLQ